MLLSCFSAVSSQDGDVSVSIVTRCRLPTKHNSALCFVSKWMSKLEEFVCFESFSQNISNLHMTSSVIHCGTSTISYNSKMESHNFCIKWKLWTVATFWCKNYWNSFSGVWIWSWAHSPTFATRFVRLPSDICDLVVEGLCWWPALHHKSLSMGPLRSGVSSEHDVTRVEVGLRALRLQFLQSANMLKNLRLHAISVTKGSS